jgi:hypothetical protein
MQYLSGWHPSPFKKKKKLQNVVPWDTLRLKIVVVLDLGMHGTDSEKTQKTDPVETVDMCIQ